MALTYIYAPLQHKDSIRLLTLHPGEFLSPLEISLAEVRSQEDPVYEALSYTWATEDGDCKQSSQIRCDGTRIWVTENCELALQYLRKEKSNRVLWVDAICINQKDDKERGHQVGMMRNVYCKATEVLVWLGESSKEVGTLDPVAKYPDAEAFDSTPLSQPPSEAALEHGHKHRIPQCAENLRSFNRVPSPVSDIFLEYLHRMTAEIRQIQHAGEDPASSPLHQELVSQIYEGCPSGSFKTYLYRGFKNIVRRRWWSRVWVVQEVTIAKSATLICSKQSINYTEIFEWFQLLYDDPSPKARRAWSHLRLARAHFRTVSQARDKMPDLLRVLRGARNLAASDPRDVIFSLLGLSDKFQSLLPHPDYSKSITQIFTDVVKGHLNQTKSLFILNDANGTTPDLGHPSWVPYWVPYWSAPRVMVNWNTYESKEVSRNSEAIYTISSDDKELRVKGREFDRIKRLPLADLRAYGSTSQRLRIEGWRKSCEIGFSLTSYPTGELVEEALMRTLCCNTGNKFLNDIEKLDGFREWYRILTSIGTPEQIGKQMRARRNPFEEYINWSSPLCTTGKGYLGAVPYTTQVGDCIVVFAGGDKPFVLRPTGDQYRLIGPCYIHGIMNGEAFPEDLDELEWFSIS